MPPDENELLLEEWKQNVALYIDQDKRGLERLKIFLTMHAGLLVFYGLVWQAPRDHWSVVMAWVIAIAGIFLTDITRRMSRRAHAFILMRKIQAMLIEAKLKTITTFTREHVSFQGEILQGDKWEPHTKEWQTLLDEIKTLGDYPSDVIFLRGKFKDSMSHLEWLDELHNLLFVLWSVLPLVITAVYVWGCFPR